jgi:hypothetical protein
MKIHHLIIATLLLSVSYLMPVQAEVLSVKSNSSILLDAKTPKRGMTMKQVRAKYGKPKKVYKSKGRVKKDWPRITRWEYGRFSVYFERRIVLHTVVHKQ